MRHGFTITQPPERSGKESIPDGAICGNGDLAVILGTATDGMRLYLSKCDVWEGIERADAGGIKPVGYIDIPVPASVYSHYYVEQDMDEGEIQCRFGDNGETGFRVIVHRGENSVCIRQTGTSYGIATLHTVPGETTGRKGEFVTNDAHGIFRSFDGENCIYPTHVFAALREVTDGVYYCRVATNHDTADPRQAVEDDLKRTDAARLDALLAEHRRLWHTFWAQSTMTLSDPMLENAWYASQYFLAVCAGNRGFPPGLYGNYITVEHPSWHGDYHLNYNYQAPFYAACSSNHPELTDAYMAPLEAFMEKGAGFAARFGCGGILLPVGVAPKGLCSEWNPDIPYSFERLFLGQKNNQLHPADIAVMRWRATRDEAFARDHAYPYLKACLAFFADYGTWDNGRFTIACDSAHEVPIYRSDFTPERYRRVLQDTNNVLTIGLLRMGLDAAIDMAHTLQTDAHLVAKWQNLRAHLPEFPTCIRLGRRVFRYTEKGQRWNETGDVGLQHVYPAGAIALLSDAKELRIARTTYRMKRRCYTDDNAVSSYYPMSARLGMPPAKTLRHLRRLLRDHRLPNGLFRLAGGCLEYCSIAASTLNEMAVQSCQDTLLLFPCWDRALDCSFSDLRADGAFLVSSSMNNGTVGTTRIYAEKGGLLRVKLPYDTAQVRHGTETISVRDGQFSIQTQPGDEVIIKSV